MSSLYHPNQNDFITKVTDEMLSDTREERGTGREVLFLKNFVILCVPKHPEDAGRPNKNIFVKFKTLKYDEDDNIIGIRYQIYYKDNNWRHCDENNRTGVRSLLLNDYDFYTTDIQYEDDSSAANNPDMGGKRKRRTSKRSNKKRSNKKRSNKKRRRSTKRRK